jgi:hypothetical protein
VSSLSASVRCRAIPCRAMPWGELFPSALLRLSLSLAVLLLCLCSLQWVHSTHVEGAFTILILFCSTYLACLSARDRLAGSSTARADEGLPEAEMWGFVPGGRWVAALTSSIAPST